MSFTLTRGHAVIVQYDADPDTDMFQVGRSSEPPIDFVVMDTVPGAQCAEDCVVTQSTISRFACRILVERNPPYTARIYAAGFDSGSNIFLGVSSTGHECNGELASGRASIVISHLHLSRDVCCRYEPNILNNI